MPTWGAWVDGAFWMEGGAQTRRMRNLALNPNAVVHVERGDDVVIVEGVGEKIVDLAPDLTDRLLAGFHKYIASHGYTPARQLGEWDLGHPAARSRSPGVHFRRTPPAGPSSSATAPAWRAGRLQPMKKWPLLVALVSWHGVVDRAGSSVRAMDGSIWVAVHGPMDGVPPEELVLEIGDTAWAWLWRSRSGRTLPMRSVYAW